VIDDYGHHPEEVRATLRAAREGLGGRRIVVFQPHRYSRTRDLFEDFLGAFDDADHLLLIDIHAAGEEPIDGVDAESLARALARRGHADVRYIADRSTLGAAVAEMARPDDVVLLMGAGDIIRDGDGVVAALSAAGGTGGGP
jgi:UDP-N-acetylmuramate--alanine ligase